MNRDPRGFAPALRPEPDHAATVRQAVDEWALAWVRRSFRLTPSGYVPRDVMRMMAEELRVLVVGPA